MARSNRWIRSLFDSQSSLPQSSGKVSGRFAPACTHPIRSATNERSKIPARLVADPFAHQLGGAVGSSGPGGELDRDRDIARAACIRPWRGSSWQRRSARPRPAPPPGRRWKRRRCWDRQGLPRSHARWGCPRGGRPCRPPGRASSTRRRSRTGPRRRRPDHREPRRRRPGRGRSDLSQAARSFRPMLPLAPVIRTVRGPSSTSSPSNSASSSSPSPSSSSSSSRIGRTPKDDAWTGRYEVLIIRSVEGRWASTSPSVVPRAVSSSS